VEDGPIAAGGSIATLYNSARSQSARVRIPFELWEADANGRTRQIDVSSGIEMQMARLLGGNSGMPEYASLTRAGRAYIQSLSVPYNPDNSAAAIQPWGNEKGVWMFCTRIWRWRSLGYG